MTAPLVGTKTGRYIVAALRKTFRYWPPKSEARKKAFRGRDWRGIDYYECGECKGTFSKKEIHIDHIRPVVGPLGITDWNEFIIRLFTPVENLRVLCKPCHKRKTNEENKERRSFKARLRKGRPVADKLRTGRRVSKSKNVRGEEVC